MRELKIAYGSSCFAKVWSNKTITFDALCERLKNTIRTPETVEEYPKLSKVERDRAKDKGGMVGGWLKQGRRKAANVECRSMLTHDIDSADPDFLERYRMLNQYASCLYSTHSHTPEAPRYRIITPLTRDVSPEEYLALTRLLAKEWGIDCVDSCSYRAHQLMYWPTTPSNGEYVFERFDGAWLNPDAFLSTHPGWRDVSLLPTSSRESTLIDRQRKQQADPLAKPGIVGAFCRTYSIEEAIIPFCQTCTSPAPWQAATIMCVRIPRQAWCSTTASLPTATMPPTRPADSCSTPLIWCAFTSSVIWTIRLQPTQRPASCRPIRPCATLRCRTRA